MLSLKDDFVKSLGINRLDTQVWARGLLTEGYEEGAKMQPGLGSASCLLWGPAMSSESWLHFPILTQAPCGPAETKPGFLEKGNREFKVPSFPF